MSYVRLDINVKEVDAGDANVLAQIHGHCFPHSWSAGTFETFLKNSVHRAYVAHVPGTDEIAVGFTLVRTIAKEAEILSIAVLPEHSGRGIATGLLYRICEILESERVEKIFLEVGRDNKSARALYRKLGFKAVGSRQAYYKGRSGDERSDAIILEKSL